MSETTIQELLPLIQMPSRYLGNEINSVQKNWNRVKLHVALAFPDLYEIATSHFGIQILYGILNEQENILAERVFAPAEDMEDLLRKRKVHLCSLESQIPLKEFDIIGFSLLYELNYTNMVNMIDLAGISFFSNQRKDTDPLLIAGGPCTCNPEPIADFFDAIVVGDGESVILQMTDEWKKWRQSKLSRREDLLLRWSQIKGVYIPSFFEFSINGDKNRRLSPKFASYEKIERTVVSDLNDAFFPTNPVIPFGKPIHDRLRMEIARGCTRGCRFCQAGMIYRPVRERNPQSILDSIKEALQKTGYEDLSLLSLSTGDYACIVSLMENIMEFGQNDHVAVSLPSLRAGSLTPELMELVKKVRKTGFTIAPEAGSQRLRDVINKNITEEDIVETVKNAFSLGWKAIKLYFMIGLPTETQEDLESIVSLVKQLKLVTKSHGNGGKMNVSIATFVPKPHTPFQWEPQISLEEASEKMNWLKIQLKIPGVKVKWQDPKVSMIEGVWSRGDRSLSKVLIKAWEEGCRFDGWTDFFNYDKWIEVFLKTGVCMNMYTKGILNTEQPLPWDHIHMGMDRSFLVKEKNRSIKRKITRDCRTGSCSNCGVCDFTSIQPISYHDQKELFFEKGAIRKSQLSENSVLYSIKFKKMGLARFFGHLEMVKIFIRSLRRENIPVRYSCGFHPMPKISFLDTLPMGMQSEEETMLVKLTEKRDPEQLEACLDRQMPDGMEITGCLLGKVDNSKKGKERQTYHVELKDGVFQQKKLDWFLSQQSVSIEKKGKKGKRVNIDLKMVVLEIHLLNKFNAMITLGKNNALTVRPAQAIEKIFNLTEQQIRRVVITKKKANYV